MSRRWLVLLVVLTLTLSACSSGSNPAAPSTPPTTAALARPTQQPTLQPTVGPAPSVAVSSEDLILTAVAGPAGTATTASTTEAEPGGDAKPSRSLEAFDERVRDALFALEELPGYSYTVEYDAEHHPYPTGLALTAKVASAERREWTLHEEGAPEHIIARWVLVGDAAYSDITGTWQRIEHVPFDTGSPVSFADPYGNVLFEPFGESINPRRSDALISNRDAILYQVQRPLGEAAFDHEHSGAVVSDYLYVAKQGGYLLGYLRPSIIGDPYSPTLKVEVTPLNQAPEIRVPKEGVAAFEGNPPPWRVFLLGRERLAGLESYRFDRSLNTYGLKIRVQGQVSERQGRVSGTVPDEYAEPEALDDDDSYDPRQAKMANLDLVYTGTKVWMRTARGKWERIPTNILANEEPNENALSLLSEVPGAPPDTVVGSRQEFGSYYGPALFGVSNLYDAAVLTEGKFIGTETVNGVRALHYEGGVNGGSYNPAEPVAEVWLAADGLYMVRQKVTFASPPDAPTPDLDESRIDIFDANELFTVKAPR